MSGGQSFNYYLRLAVTALIHSVLYLHIQAVLFLHCMYMCTYMYAYVLFVTHSPLHLALSLAVSPSPL